MLFLLLLFLVLVHVIEAGEMSVTSASPLARPLRLFLLFPLLLYQLLLLLPMLLRLLLLQLSLRDGDKKACVHLLYCCCDLLAAISFHYMYVYLLLH